MQEKREKNWHSWNKEKKNRGSHNTRNVEVIGETAKEEMKCNPHEQTATKRLEHRNNSTS